MSQRSSFFSTSLVRGLIAMILGVPVGMALVTGIRFLVGLPAWKAEPAWVGGALIGVVTFMVGTGVLGDWLKWARGEETPEHPETPERKGWAKYLNVSFDHKVIGIQYGVTSLILFSLAGLFALTFRTELAQTGLLFKDEYNILGMSGLGFYNTIMSLHGIVMIGAMLIGVGAMSNYLVPLMIGANDMAFPRLNAFAYWINVPGAVLLGSTLFLGGFDTGWTGYPP